VFGVALGVGVAAVGFGEMAFLEFLSLRVDTEGFVEFELSSGKSLYNLS